MILERGIELNELYHPDPRQYDYSSVDSTIDNNDDGGIDDNDDVNPLKFRCYEAHIPYTMQFFKDYNLAGMKYIKVKEARFRTPLPRSLRIRTKEEFDTFNDNDQHVTSGGITVNGVITTTVKNDDSFFFAHTVPNALVWPQSSLDSSTTNRQDTTNTTTTTRLKNEHWLIKETCCDLEFDCTVQQLRNV
jgi:hypothetical protein